MRALAAIALVACGSATPAPVLDSRAAAPTTPPPRIAWRTTAFDTTELPRIARTGGAAVIAIVDHDGGRGYPNLRFEVRDQADQIVDKHVVMTVLEYERLVPDGIEASAELESRIARANDWLAKKHAVYDLIAMRSDARIAATHDATRWRVPNGQRCAQCEPCENQPYVADAFTADGTNVVVLRIAYRGTDTCWEPPDQWHVLRR